MFFVFRLWDKYRRGLTSFGPLQYICTDRSQPTMQTHTDIGLSLLLFCLHHFDIPYFFTYKKELFFLPKQSQNLDSSYKMDLDLWDCLGRVKLIL